MEKNKKGFTITNQQRDNLVEEINKLYREKFGLRQEIEEQQQQTKALNEELFLNLLEVFDALEFLLNSLQENTEVTPQLIKRLPKNLATVQKKLLKVLEQRQVTIINFQKEQPDFSCCQVVDREIRNDIEEQTITKIVRHGFRIEDKILRPSEVITAKHSDDNY